MASVRQIANQAGVSIATVSRVINNSPKVSDAAREKVLDAMNASRYTPKIGRLLHTNVAYIFTDAMTLGSSYDTGIMAGMGSGLEYHELDLLILNGKSCRQPNETFQDVFRRKGVRGAIVRTTSSSQTLCRAILESGLPVIVLGDEIQGHEEQCVDVDSRSASADAVEHLIGLGHRQIAFCNNVVDDKDHSDRIAGYLDAHEHAGLTPDPKLTFRVPANRQGGEQLARRLASMAAPPTAIFVADPETCMGLLNESRVLGVDIPGDLSVVGFDDVDIRHSTAPALSAVCQDARRLGEEALRRLVNQFTKDSGSLDQPDTPMQAWFEVNASTALVKE